MGDDNNRDFYKMQHDRLSQNGQALYLAQLGKATISELIELTHELCRILKVYASVQLRATLDPNMRLKRNQVRDRTCDYKDRILKKFKLIDKIHQTLDDLPRANLDKPLKSLIPMGNRDSEKLTEETPEITELQNQRDQLLKLNDEKNEQMKIILSNLRMLSNDISLAVPPDITYT